MKKTFISTIVLCLFVIGEIFSQSVSITPTNDEILVTKYGSGTPNLAGRQSTGSSAAPTASSAGTGLVSFSGRGHTGSVFTSDRASISMLADQTFTSTANGTRMTFSTTLNGTTSNIERMRIDNNGKIGIGATNPTARLQITHDGADTDPHLKLHTTGLYSRINWTTATNANVWTAQSSLESATAATNYWTLEYNGTRHLYVKGDGDIGIGTANPSTRLNLSSGNFLMETGSTDKLLLKQDGTGSAGEMVVYTNTGLKSLEVKGSDGTGTAGEINLYIPSTQVKTVEIDGDWAGSDKSRIVVDELQIKGGADLAEFFTIKTLTKLEAGTVVSVSEDNSGNLQLSTKAYDKKVVGIISGANGISTGLMLHQKGNEMADGDYPIAINGRVYVKADATHNAIKPGDLLTSSDMAGYAMKASNNKKSQGAVLGKALTGLDNNTGMVLVLLGVK